MMSKILHTQVEKTGKQYLLKVAVEDEASRLHYEALDLYSNRISQCLVENHTKRRAKVAVFQESCTEYIAALLGINKAGAAFLPLEVNFPVARTCSILEQVRPDTIITNVRQSDALIARLGLQGFASLRKVIVLTGPDTPIVVHTVGDNQVLHTEEKQFEAGRVNVQVDENDSNYLIYTSGTTGTPKIIEGRHKSLAHFINWEVDELGLTDANRVCQFAPVSFDVSLRDIFVPLSTGGTLCIPGQDTKTNIDKFAGWLVEKQITLLHIVPSMFRLLTENLKAHPEKAAGLSLRYVLFAGEPLYAKDVAHWRDVYGDRARLINLYGPSETTLAKAYYEIGELPAGANAIIPLGKPISDTALLVLKQNRLCNKRETGEIFIKTPYRSKGYYRNPELTAQHFIQNPLHNDYEDIVYRTGDMGRYLDNWDVEFLGRTDSQIKIQGNRVELLELQKLVMDFAGITQVVVVPLPAESGELVLVCYYTESQAVSTDQLRDYLAQYLPQYARPSVFYKMDAFPVTLNGKIDRNRLPKPQELYLGDAQFEAPRTELEVKLAGIWSDVLRTGVVGVHHSFFQLGGNSLSAIQIISRIYKELGYEIKLKDFFDQPTIRQLVGFITTLANKPSAQITPAPPQEYYPVSLAQHRLCLLSQVPEANTAYNIFNAYTLTGAVDTTGLEAALNALVERHESLRTVFVQRNGKFYQQILATQRVPLLYTDVSADPHPDRLCREIAASEAGHAFDIGALPLARVHLVKLAEARHVVVITFHHVISDGWSMQVFFRELLEQYHHYLTRRPRPSVPLAFQYKDYAHWQREKAARNQLELYRPYWQKKLAGPLPVLDLPTDYARPRMRQFHGAEINVRLDKDNYASIRSVCRQTGTSLFMFLLASLKTLLYRYTGQTDIIIGTIHAGREHRDLVDQIGFYVNTLPLRTRFTGQATFASLLGDVRTQLLEAYEHQAYPFDLLLEELAIKYSPDRSPVFDVMVNMATQPLPQEQTEAQSEAGIRIEEYAVGRTTSKCDLTFSFYEAPDALAVTIEYDTDLFKPDRIGRMGEHLAELIKSIAGNMHAALDAYCYIPDAERAALRTFNGTPAGPRTGKTIQEIFEAQVEAFPERIAVVCEDNHLTYAALNRRVNRLASYLCGQYGNKQENVEAVIGLVNDHTEWCIVGMLAILKSGRGYLPVDLNAPQGRVRYMLREADVKLLLHGPAMQAASLGWTGVDCVSMPDACRQEREGAAGNPAPATTGADIAYIMYTSGSTGIPKGVVVEQRSVVNLVKETNYCALTGADRVIRLSNYAFDGSVFEVFGALLNGAQLHLTGEFAHFSAESLSAWIQSRRITTMFITTALFNNLVEANPGCFRELDKVYFGGERYSVYHLREALRVQKRPGSIVHVYGPTEATTFSTYYEVGGLEGWDERAPIGFPIANVQCYLLDAAGQTTPIGLNGEIYVGGAGLARGYLNDPELTHDKFVRHGRQDAQRLYRTGDIGRWTETGAIEFVGRNDFQVKLRGHRIELGEVEKAVKTLEGIKGALATLWTDHSGDTHLVVYYVAAQAMPVQELRRELLEKLPAYMVPSFFTRLPAFPLTATGKIDTRRLPPPDAGQPGNPGVDGARDETERVLLEIFTQVFGNTEIGRRHDFFEIGGNSLKAMQIISRIDKFLHKKITIKDVLLHPTVEKLAVAVSSHGDAGPQPVISIEEQDHYGLSYGQQRMFMLCQVEQGNLSYNLNLGVALRGQVDAGALEAAFRTLVRQHENLRTRFVWVDNQPRARIASLHPDALLVQCIDLRGHEGKDTEASRIVARESATAFDLQKGPLFRVKLIRTDEAEYIMLISIHHLVCDGWSLKVMETLLFSLYAAYHRGEPVDLPPPPVHYKDYVAWEKLKNKRREPSEVKAFWSRQLEGGVKKANLPTDRTGRHQANQAGNTVWFGLGPELVEGIHQLSKKYNVTLYVSMLSAFVAFLARLCRQEAITLFVGNAGRTQLDFEKVIGYFIEAYYLKSHPQFNQSFETLLHEVNQSHLDIMGYDNYLSEAPKAWSEIAQGGCNVAFQLENQEVSDQALKAGLPLQLEHKGISRSNGTAKTDLLLHVFESRQEITCSFEYNTALFTESRINSFIESFKNVVRQLVATPAGSIDGLVLNTGGEEGLLSRLNLPPGQVQYVYPLTHIQRDIYLSSKFNPDGLAFRPRFYNVIAEDIDVEAWHGAVRRATEAFAILSSEVIESGDEVFLAVRKNKEVHFQYCDLTGRRLDRTQLPAAIKERIRVSQRTDHDLISHFLFKADAACYVYAISVHHLIFDGLSAKIFYERVNELYRRRAEQQAPGQEDAGSRAASANRGVYGFDTERIEAFWREKLAGVEKLNRNALTKAPDEYVKDSLSLDKHRQERIEAYCTTQGVSLPNFLKGIYALLIRYYCQHKGSFFFRHIISDREAYENQLLGCYFTSMPVVAGESVFAGDTTPDAYFRSYRTQRREAHDFRRISGFLLNQLIGEESIKFYFNYLTFHKLNKEGQEKYLYDVIDFAEEEVHLIIKELNGVVCLELNHNKKIFFADHFLDRFVSVAEQVVNGVGRLAEIDFLLPGEHALLTERFTGNPNCTLIHKHFEDLAARTPDAVAIVCHDRALTYRELNRQANCLADKLRNELKLAPGSYVGLLMTKTEQAIVAIMGILKAGAAYLPVDPTYPADRISYLLRDSAVNVLISDNGTLPDGLEPAVTVIRFDEFLTGMEQYRSANLPLINRITDAAYVIYTSGTTGKPKGVVVEHRNITSLLLHDNAAFRFNDTDVWSVFHSLNFDFSVWEIFGGLLNGGKIVVVPGLTDIRAFVDIIFRHRITVLNQVPSIFYRVQEEILRSQTHRTPRLRTIVFGGEALRPALLKDWYASYPHIRLINAYGITETTVHVTFKDIGGSEIEEGMSNVGRPLGNMRMLVADPQGSVLPAGLTGEILVGGYGLSRGYLNRAALTAERFVDNRQLGEKMYRSGDLGRRLPNGDFEYIGRLDNQVKVRGYRIELDEIEQTLLGWNDILGAATVLVKNELGENQIACYYTSVRDLSPADLRLELSKVLPAYLIPAYLIRLDHMPLTANGKVNKQNLPPPESPARADRAAAPPTNDVEKALLGIWEEVLGKTAIGIQDNFFEIGGDSIRVIMLYRRINALYPGLVEIHNLYSYPTIEAIAGLMKKEDAPGQVKVKTIKKIDF